MVGLTDSRQEDWDDEDIDTDFAKELKQELNYDSTA